MGKTIDTALERDIATQIQWLMNDLSRIDAYFLEHGYNRWPGYSTDEVVAYFRALADPESPLIKESGGYKSLPNIAIYEERSELGRGLRRFFVGVELLGDRVLACDPRRTYSIDVHTNPHELPQELAGHEAVVSPHGYMRLPDQKHSGHAPLDALIDAIGKAL